MNENIRLIAIDEVETDTIRRGLQCVMRKKGVSETRRGAAWQLLEHLRMPAVPPCILVEHGDDGVDARASCHDTSFVQVLCRRRGDDRVTAHWPIWSEEGQQVIAEAVRQLSRRLELEKVYECLRDTFAGMVPGSMGVGELTERLSAAKGQLAAVA